MLSTSPHPLATRPAPPPSHALVRAHATPEIHPKIADFVIKTAARYGLNERAVCDILHISLDELPTCKKQMSWNMFATLLNAYLATTTHDHFIQTFWDDFQRQPINTNLMRIFRNVASPAKLYSIMDRYVGPRLLPCLRGSSHLNEEGLLVDEIEHISPEGAVPCPIYFHLVIESLCAAPELMMGLQHSVLLDFETDGLSARYTLKLPPSRSLLRRVRDASKIFLGARSLFELLETHQEEQHQTYERLSALNEELEQRVSQRTQQLAALNQQLEQSRDQALRESSAKSRYLANMSHEIRTPLSAIIGYAELLEEEAAEQVNEQFASDLQSITQSAKHLLALIGDILDLSKIEADKLSIIKEHTMLRPVIDEIIQGIKPLADDKHNLLKLTWEVPQHFQLSMDSMRVRQILMNLLSNAVKFTHHGKIFVIVECARDTLHIHIKDTGIGMSKEEVARIFQPFEQAQSTTSHHHGGTGLGMTISRQLAELMGGTLDVHSAPGQGSTFTLSLPASS